MEDRSMRLNSGHITTDSGAPWPFHPHCRDLSEMSISQLKCPRDVHMDISDAGRPSRSCGRRFHSASASLLDRG